MINHKNYQRVVGELSLKKLPCSLPEWTIKTRCKLGTVAHYCNLKEDNYSTLYWHEYLPLHATLAVLQVLCIQLRNQSCPQRPCILRSAVTEHQALWTKSKTRTRKFWIRFDCAHAFKVSGFWTYVERVVLLIYAGSPTDFFQRSWFLWYYR